jgi:thioredoxin reductase (NADPH)
MYDITIIGSGPAGLSAALAADRWGLDHLVLERGVIADTVFNFPVAKKLFSTADEIELEPGTFDPQYKPTREELLSHYVSVVHHNHLNVVTGSEVASVTRSGGGFEVTASSGVYQTRTVLSAVGGFGRQRRLGVPGESDARVSYRFIEAHPYAMKNVVVVGAGNSAAEASIWLAEVGAQVYMVVRRGSLDMDPIEKEKHPEKAQIKPWVRQTLNELIEQGRIQLLTSGRVVEIRPRTAVIGIKSGDTREALCLKEAPCDHLFALIGADPDTRLLEEAGATIAHDGRPVYDPETYQASVDGLYVAGHLTRERHIKNAIKVGRTVADSVAAQIRRNVCMPAMPSSPGNRRGTLGCEAAKSSSRT